MFKKRAFQIISIILAALFLGSVLFALIYYGLS